MIKYLDWDQFLKTLFAAVEKAVSFKSDYGRDNDWKSVSRFSRELIGNVTRKVSEIIEELNKDLKKIGLSLDMMGQSHIDLVSCVYCWKQLSDGIESYLKKPITEMENQKEDWRNIYISSVQNDPAEISRSNSKNFHERLYSSLKEQALQEVSKQITDYFGKKASHFTTLEIQRQLDQELLYRGAHFDDVFNYINNQSLTIENRFQREWDKSFAEQKQLNVGTYKATIRKVFIQAREAYEKLQEAFLSEGLTEFQCIKLFSPKNMQNDFVVKSQHEKMFNKAGVRFFYDFMTGNLSKSWSCTIKDNVENLEKEESFTYAHDCQFQDLKCVKLEVSTHLRGLNNGDFEIPILYEFLLAGISILKDKIQSIDNETGGWKEPELELDSVYNQLKNSTLGCNVTCLTCGRKCDKPFQHATKHFCELGHQIRGMKGVRRGEGNLSTSTCDEIGDDELIEIQDVNGRRRIKWSEFKSKEGKDWQFKCLSEDQIIQNRVKYDSCWDSYGRDFCKKFGEIFNTTITFESKIQVEHAHFIICLDGSGSMAGSRWQASVDGAAAFMDKLKSGSYLKPENCDVSLIIFDHQVQKEIHCKRPERSLCYGLNFPHGGTNFDPPLIAAMNLIANHEPKYDM